MRGCLLAAVVGLLLVARAGGTRGQELERVWTVTPTDPAVADLEMHPDGTLYVAHECELSAYAGGQFTVVPTTRCYDDVAFDAAGNGFGSSGDLVFHLDGMNEPYASMFGKGDIAVAPDGTALYAADWEPCVIRSRVNGVVSIVAGTGSCPIGVQPVVLQGPALSIDLRQPRGLVVGPDGALYFVEANACVVRRLANGQITTVAGNGQCAYNGDGAPPLQSSLFPAAIAFDEDGALYVGDAFSCRILKVTTIVTTVAGIGPGENFEDCDRSEEGTPAVSSRFDSLEELAIGSNGDIYLSETLVISQPLPQHDLRFPRIAIVTGNPSFDGDGDGTRNLDDNCTVVANAVQEDADADGVGDACDDDDDGDGHGDGVDNCPLHVNADQADLDGDTLGDPCDEDEDGDGIDDTLDNCYRAANPGQEDSEGDGAGDACDPNSAVANVDGDACTDGAELGVLPNLGGQRDPLDPWDFFDVTGDAFIDLGDTLSVLSFFGDPGSSPAGNQRDRFIPLPASPWRTAEANDGVDLTDALVNLKSYGHACAGLP